MVESSRASLLSPALLVISNLLSSSNSLNTGTLVQFNWIEVEAFTVEEVVENKGSSLACMDYCQALACSKAFHFDADSRNCRLGTITALGPKGARSSTAIRVVAAEQDIPTERSTHIFVTKKFSKNVALSLSPSTSPPIEQPNFPSWSNNAVGFWYLGSAMICGGNDEDFCQYYSFSRGEAGGTTSKLSRFRRRSSTVLYQGRPWIIGGKENAGDSGTDSTDILSEDGSTWNPGPTFPTVIVDACGVPLNDDASRHMIIGGKTTNFNEDGTAATWIHDDANPGVWTGGPDLSSARFQVQCQRVTLTDGRDVAVAAGGRDVNNDAVKVVEVYDIAAGTWGGGPELPEARCDGTLFVAGGRLFFVGGSDGSGTIYYNVLELRLDLSGWDEVTEMATTGQALQQAIAFVY